MDKGIQTKTDWHYVWRQVKKYKVIYFMLIPIALYFIIFSYYPLFLGIVKSFQKSKMIGPAEFIGLENYAVVLQDFRYMQALRNTLIMAVGTFALQFIMGLVIAISLNEAKNKYCKTIVQTFTYIPNLLSWAVVAGIWISMLSPGGMVNGLLDATNIIPGSKIVFMAEPDLTYAIYIFTAAWKGAGYYAVLFLAAIVSISPAVYEAATIDGATKIQQIVKITIPSIVPTMKVIAVLASMSILRNFDQIFAMQNSVVIDKARTLLYHIYLEGITKFQVGTATAAATLVLIITLLITVVVRRLTKYDDTYAG